MKFYQTFLYNPATLQSKLCWCREAGRRASRVTDMPIIHGQNSKSRIEKVGRDSSIRGREERERTVDLPPVLFSAFHERSIETKIDNFNCQLKVSQSHILFFSLDEKYRKFETTTTWPRPNVSMKATPNSPFLPEPLPVRNRARPLSHYSQIKMLSWRETMPSSHFTVSAAILHRVKVKVLCCGNRRKKGK